MVLIDVVVWQVKIIGKVYIFNDIDGLVLFVIGKGVKKWYFCFIWMSK